MAENLLQKQSNVEQMFNSTEEDPEIIRQRKVLRTIAERLGQSPDNPLIARQIEGHFTPEALARRRRECADLSARYARRLRRPILEAKKQEELLSEAKEEARAIFDVKGHNFLRKRLRVAPRSKPEALVSSTRNWLVLIIKRRFIPKHRYRQHLELSREALVSALWTEEVRHPSPAQTFMRPSPSVASLSGGASDAAKPWRALSRH